jgi:hypothetical protein
LPSHVICVTLAIAFVSTVASAQESYEDDPVPFVMESDRESQINDRALGFGWNVALGALVGDKPDFRFGTVTFDAAFEVRLFVANTFSFDFQIEIGESIVEKLHLGQWTSFHLTTYFHMHVDPHVDGYFSAAPYVAVHAYIGEEETIPAIQIGARAGAEVLNDPNTFGIGFYGRPGMRMFKSENGDINVACEVVFEMTWTGYILKGRLQK